MACLRAFLMFLWGEVSIGNDHLRLAVNSDSRVD